MLFFLLQEKKNYPLHVAAKEGQILQVELLLTYGANPCIVDSNGNTPAMCAKQLNEIFLNLKYYTYIFFRLSGHKDINERLNDSMYEVLDVISMYVSGRKADHKNGEHMVNINLFDDFVKEGDQQEAIKKMQQVIRFNIFRYYFINF